MQLNKFSQLFKRPFISWLKLYTSLFVISIMGYSFLRFSFLVWNWSLFKSIAIADILKAILVGLRFDACAIAILFVPLFLISLVVPLLTSQKIFKNIWLAIIGIVHIPFLVLNVIDIEFFNFSGRRFTLSSLFIFQEVQGKMGGFLSTYLPGTIAGILLIVVYMWFVQRAVRKESLNPVLTPKGLGSHIGIHFLILVFLGILGRGGFQKKPIDFVDVSLFNAPILNNLVLNSSFSLIKSSDKDKLPQIQFFSQPDQYLPLLNGYGEKKSTLDSIRKKKKQNVVVILLESFSLEYMGAPHHQIGYTPFLDDLAKRSLFFTQAFANGRRSIEGVSSIIAGIPALMSEAFITSEFASNYFVGLGSILSEHKYHSSFFHGGNNGTMYFDRFTRSAGIPAYYGSNQYTGPSSDHDQVWGIYDGPFFQFFGRKLGDFPEPFFSMIFSLSSHHPYRIPESYKHKYKKGPLEILESIQYTDESLKDFFEYAKNQSWYNNTLFIITSDHTQKNLRESFDNELGRFRVPLMFYHPTFNWNNVNSSQPVQHIDILPSIMDFLGFENKFKILLGESVFKQDDDKTVLLLNDNLYYQISSTFITVWDKHNKIKHYSVKDLRLESPIELTDEIRGRLEKKLKASIQYFNQGMWDNRLYFPGK